MVRMSLPLLWAASGELMVEKCGMLNVGIEGVMLLGAFWGYVAGVYFHSIGLAFCVAALIGLAAGCLLGLLYITLRVDTIAAGIAFNIFAFGITEYFFKSLLARMAGDPPQIGVWQVPFLRRLPLVGEWFAEQNGCLYATCALLLLLYALLYHTQFGLKLRVIGDNPLAAESAGIPVRTLRYVCLMLSTAAVAVGGAILSLVNVSAYTSNMTSGRGFIALALVIFGCRRIRYVLCGGVMFGLLEAFQLRLQVLYPHVPYQLLSMLPYAITIGVLVLVSGKHRTYSSS